MLGCLTVRMNERRIEGYTGKKKFARGYTGVSKLFKGIEVITNFHKSIQVKDSVWFRSMCWLACTWKNGVLESPSRIACGFLRCF